MEREKRTEPQLARIRAWLELANFKHVRMEDVRGVIPQLAQARPIAYVGHAAAWAAAALST